MLMLHPPLCCVQVTVTEQCSVIKPLLLDLIYDRAVQIRALTVLQVFNLADKYQAPTIMEACRRVHRGRLAGN